MYTNTLTTLVTLLGTTLALPAPAPQTTSCPNPAHCGTSPSPSIYENIDISSYYLRKSPSIQSVSFNLSSLSGSAGAYTNTTDLVCEIGPVESLPSEVVLCGESAYRFGLYDAGTGNGTEVVGVRVYHQTAPFVGRWGEGVIPTYCRAGGNGQDDFICDQVVPVTIVIS